MKRPALVLRAMVPITVGALARFLGLRRLFRRLSWPKEERRQARLAMVLAILPALPAVLALLRPSKEAETREIKRKGRRETRREGFRWMPRRPATQ